MDTQRQDRGRLRLALATAVFLVAADVSGESAEVEIGEIAQSPRIMSLAANVRVKDPTTASAVQRAVTGADEWLARPKCQRVFSDFEDRSGKRLSEVLAEQRTTGREHLRRVFFYDGSRLRLCERTSVAAVTAVGGRAIFVCPKGFREGCQSPVEARATIIHELLHSLGLGENPPSSREITLQVLRRCSH